MTDIRMKYAREIACEAFFSQFTTLHRLGRYDAITRCKTRMTAIRAGNADDFPTVQSAFIALTRPWMFEAIEKAEKIND